MARGSVRKRGNKWCYIIPIGKYENGRTRYKWVGGFESEEEANEERILALREQRKQERKEVENCVGYEPDFTKTLCMMMAYFMGQRHDDDIQYPNSTITVTEYLADWFDVAKLDLRPCTQRGYWDIIRLHIIPYIGNIRLWDLRPSHIQTLYDDLRKERYSSTTVLYVHRVLRKALKKAVRVYIRANPADEVENKPKKADYEAHPMNGEQTKKLLTAAKKTVIFIAILLAVCLGLRRGEVLGLKWNRIDFEKRKILIDNIIVYEPGGIYEGPPKTKKGKRSLKISEGLTQILKTLKEETGAQDDGYVICRKDGRPFSASTLQSVFKRLLKEAGISEDTRIHDLKHTSATLQLRAGVAMKVVSQRLGHSSIVITMDLYGHVLDDMQDQAATAMDDLLV